jgi:hypothetical protein
MDIDKRHYYVQGETMEQPRTRYYYPDFVLPNGIIIEAKGYLRLKDKQKYRQVKKCYPDLDLRLVFQAPTGTAAGDNGAWCRKYRIPYACGQIPREWFKEESLGGTDKRLRCLLTAF